MHPTGGIKPGDNAAFGVEPQGYGMANRLAYGPVTADWASFSCKRFQYGGIVAGSEPPSHAIVVYTASHYMP